MASARELRPLGPLSMLDRALVRCHESFSQIAWLSFGGGALIAAVVIAIYYLERIEGISSLRLPLALLLTLAFGSRAILLGRAARRVTLRLWSAQPKEDAGRIVDVLRTAMVAALGLWVWSWFFVVGSLGGAVGILLVAPLLALRGAAAPSWLARASCESDAGFRGFFRAAGDNAHHRFAGVVMEAMLLLGTIGLAINIYLVTAIAMLLLRGFAGLELASLETFLSPQNTFVLLCVGSVAFVAMEPLRATVSALHFVDGRVRAEGLDLRAALEDAMAHSERRGPRSTTMRAAVLLLALALAPSARAQELPAEPVSESADRATEERVRDILAEPEFREFADHRGEGLRRLVERIFAWLGRPRDRASRFEPPGIGQLPIPGAWFFLGAAACLLLVVGAYLLLTRRREERAAQKAHEASTEARDPRDRAPTSFLDDAARLAEKGELREAMRALYLATLVALDRQRLIAFDPHRTNWQYARQMPRGDTRDAFLELTRLFDHKWYGCEPTTQPDYVRCRSLACTIVEPEAT